MDQFALAQILSQIESNWIFVHSHVCLFARLSPRINNMSPPPPRRPEPKFLFGARSPAAIAANKDSILVGTTRTPYVLLFINLLFFPFPLFNFFFATWVRHGCIFLKMLGCLRELLRTYIYMHVHFKFLIPQAFFVRILLCM